MNDHTAKVSINGADLAFAELGAGQPVVFVHGALSDLRCWSAQIPVVGESYRAITYSRRYHFPNEPIANDQPDPWDRHVDDLAALLRAADAAPAHLVGNSQGAFIILLLAIRHPELVRSLVLAEPPVLSLYMSTPPRIGEVFKFLATHPVTAISNLRFGIGTIAPAERAFREGRDEDALLRFVNGALGDRTIDGLDPDRLSQGRANLAPLRAFMLGEGFPALSGADVRSVPCPVLLVTGSDTARFMVHLTDRLEGLLPAPERIVIHGAAHLSHEDNPEAFNAAVLDFVSRHARE